MHLPNCRYLIVFLVLTFSRSKAQHAIYKIDSLNALVKEMQNFDSSNLIINQIIKDSKSINYTRGMVNAILTKGTNLYDHGKFEAALELTLSCEKFILGTNEYAIISHIYALRGDCYGSLLFYEKSNQYLNLSHYYAKKIIDDNTRYEALGRVYGIRANNIENNQLVPINLDSVIYYRKKSYQIYQKIIGGGPAKNGAMIQCNLVSRAFLVKNNIDSAKYYLNQSIAISKKYQLQKNIGETYVALGALKLKENDLDSSSYYYERALEVALQARKLANIKECYQKLSVIYEGLGNKSKTYHYLKKYGSLSDSLIIANKNGIKTSSDIVLKEKENAFTEQVFYYVIIIFTCLASLVILIYSLLTFRKKHEKTVELHKVKSEHLYEKFELLKANTNSDKVDDDNITEVIRLAMSNEPSFLIKFQQFHPLFIQKLMERAPSLVTSDLLICAHLRLGFYTKEIATYTGLTVRAIEGKKYRIRKKLSIPASEDINVWMMQV